MAIPGRVEGPASPRLLCVARKCFEPIVLSFLVRQDRSSPRASHQGGGGPLTSSTTRYGAKWQEGFCKIRGSGVACSQAIVTSEGSSEQDRNGGDAAQFPNEFSIDGARCSCAPRRWHS